MNAALQQREYEMSADEQIRENTRNIATLATSVTELSTMFKVTEETRKEERADVKAVVTELKALNQKMVSIDTLQKDVSQLMGDVRALYEKNNGLNLTVTNFEPLKEKQVEADKKLVDHEGRINAIESWKDKKEGAWDGGKFIVHILWAFISIGGLSMIGWLVTHYQNFKIGASIGGE